MLHNYRSTYDYDTVTTYMQYIKNSNRNEFTLWKFYYVHPKLELSTVISSQATGRAVKHQSKQVDLAREQTYMQ